MLRLGKEAKSVHAEILFGADQKQTGIAVVPVDRLVQPARTRLRGLQVGQVKDNENNCNTDELPTTERCQISKI